MDALIFIDTNICLDFYRARSSDVAVALLDHVGSQVGRVISTSQVEMEYLKNRQDVILESLKGIKNDWQLTIPVLFAQAKSTKALDSRRKEIDKHLKALRTRVEGVLRDPTKNDPVFRKVWDILRHDGPYVLGRENDSRAAVRRLAWKRFMLGYPPRKDRDTSIGDAINWEWMIRCVEKSGKHLIIVSRDSDYGRQYSKTPIINDWLRLEFRERISKRRKLILTDRLSEAFRLVAAPVSEKEEASEAALIAEVKAAPAPPPKPRDIFALHLSPEDAHLMTVIAPAPGKWTALEEVVAKTGLSAAEVIERATAAMNKLEAVKATSKLPSA